MFIIANTDVLYTPPPDRGLELVTIGSRRTFSSLAELQDVLCDFLCLAPGQELLRLNKRARINDLTRVVRRPKVVETDPVALRVIGFARGGLYDVELAKPLHKVVYEPRGPERTHRESLHDHCAA